uniref:Uncharacterized protein n=1 Tax=Gasterosteus aculeatus aculeatus TaxID=481459 RepID=A0AAQ4RFS7_GASAC
MGNAVRGAVAFVPSERCQRYLVGDLREMPPDRTLDLSGRQLRRLPVAACVFHELVKLYLSDNNLSTLPAEVQGLKKLQLLALDFNCFEDILYLGNNKLYSLHGELSQLFTTAASTLRQTVVTLHLGFNQIESLPTELRLLEELRGNLARWEPAGGVPVGVAGNALLSRHRRESEQNTSLPGPVSPAGHNPCVNPPVVGEGVRRVGRWADSPDDVPEGDGSKAAGETAAQVTEVQPEEEPSVRGQGTE